MDQNKLDQNKLDLYSSFNKSCIRNILHLKYKNDENCSICLLPMLNKLVLHTPCQHYFHYTCIKSVYTSQYIYKYKCPLCRYDLTNAIFNSINIQHKPLGANVMGANAMGANKNAEPPPRIVIILIIVVCNRNVFNYLFGLHLLQLHPLICCDCCDCCDGR